MELFTIGNPNTAVGQTLNLGTTATISGKTKVINLGYRGGQVALQQIFILAQIKVELPQLIHSVPLFLATLLLMVQALALPQKILIL